MKGARCRDVERRHADKLRQKRVQCSRDHGFDAEFDVQRRERQRHDNRRAIRDSPGPVEKPRSLLPVQHFK
jgi:hypothetical protein